MTIKVFNLVNNKNNMAEGQLAINTTKYDYSVAGVAFIPCSWSGETNDVMDKEFFATYSVKLDGCSHFWFSGQDYYEGKEKEYPYYHICGTEGYLNHIRMMQFILEVAANHLGEKFFDMELDDLNEMRKLGLLNEYTITEIAVEEWEIEELDKLIGK